MTVKKKSKDKVHTPEWAKQPFQTYLEQTSILIQLMELSTRGISVLTKMPVAIEALMDVKSQDDEGNEYSEKLNAAKKSAKLAEEEIDADFPLLHSQGLVTLWAYLEASVKTFIIEWLKNTPEAYQTEPIRSLKIKVSDYMSLDDDERHAFMFSVYEQKILNGESGVKKFEKLLEPFGFSGPLHVDLKKDLQELAQIRNSIIHKNSMVDHHFISRCQSLEYKLGDKINVSSKEFFKYAQASHTYITLLICRVREHFGTDMQELHQRALEPYNIKAISNEK